LVPAGDYTVTPTKGGYSFTPSSRSVSITDANVADKDFTGTIMYPDMTISSGQTYQMLSGSTLGMDFVVQSGGILRNLDDSPAVNPIISGDIDNQEGGVCGHAGGTRGSITVNGSQSGLGSFIGEFSDSYDDPWSYAELKRTLHNDVELTKDHELT
jgi:hypothetical protein